MARGSVLRHPLFVGAAALYGAYLLAHRGLHWPLPTPITSYLSDVLCLPLMLSLALVVHQWLINQRAILPGSWVLGAWLGVAGWFEGLLPLWAPQATADPRDVLAYGLGALAFQRWLNRPAGGPVGTR